MICECSAVPYASHLIRVWQSVLQKNGCPDNVADFLQTSRFGILKMNLGRERLTSGISSVMASLELFVSAWVFNSRFLPLKHGCFL